MHNVHEFQYEYAKEKEDREIYHTERKKWSLHAAAVVFTKQPEIILAVELSTRALIRLTLGRRLRIRLLFLAVVIPYPLIVTHEYGGL
jgi:hypothetical protein